MEDWKATLGRMKDNSAKGLDGWTVAELKVVPRLFSEKLLALLRSNTFGVGDWGGSQKKRTRICTEILKRRELVCQDPYLEASPS